MSKKGRQYEFWVREAISRGLNIPKDDLVIGSASESGADVYPHRNAVDLFPFAVEAKNQKVIKIPSYWAQAKRNAEGNFPVVIMHRPEEDLVVLDMKTFLSILSARDTEKDIRDIFNDMDLPKISEARLR